MDSYLLAIPLPTKIRTRLASLCYGLPQMRWIDEENFHLTLRYFGPLSDQQLDIIQERLQTLFFTPFSFNLQGIEPFQSKNHRGALRVGISHDTDLFTLKKKIDGHLQNLSLPSEEHAFHPHVTLGHYERLNGERLGDYLSACADYQSESIEVTECLLLRTHSTPKRIFYQTLEHYLVSSPATGED